MLKNLEREQFIKNIWAGVIGGVLGAMAGFWYNTSLSIFIGTAVGFLMGMGMQNFIGTSTLDKTPQDDSNFNQSTMQLREEQLDISKRLVETGKVSMRKEVITKKKVIVVPVTREELVIDQWKLNELDIENMDEGKKSTIRIPLKEERIEVIKHPVVLEDVEVYKRQLHENEHITETLKREEIQIKTSGNPKIINKEP